MTRESARLGKTMTTKKKNAPTTSVFALVSALGAVARRGADSDLRELARTQLSAYLADLRRKTPRRTREAASRSGMQSKAPVRDHVDELIDALGILARLDSTPAARAAALDKLTAHLETLLGEGPPKPEPAATEAASMAMLKKKLGALGARVGRVEAAASIARMKARAARPVVDPSSLGMLLSIDRAAKNAMIGLKGKKSA